MRESQSGWKFTKYDLRSTGKEYKVSSTKYQENKKVFSNPSQLALVSG